MVNPTSSLPVQAERAEVASDTLEVAVTLGGQYIASYSFESFEEANDFITALALRARGVKTSYVVTVIGE